MRLSVCLSDCRFPLPPPTLEITILLEKTLIFSQNLTDFYAIPLKKVLFHTFHLVLMKKTVFF